MARSVAGILDIKTEGKASIMNLPAKFFKYYEYVSTKASKALREQCFTFQGARVRYIYEPQPSSRELVVVFSACTREGIKARYNYMRTLHEVPSNRLFILDDGGPDKRGSYYLGRYPDFEFKAACECLIRRICEKHGIVRATYVGSSKGGWSALLFGMTCDLFDGPPRLIVGAPQYWLGRYLDNQFPGSEVPASTLDGVAGSWARDEVISALDDMLRKAIEGNDRLKHQDITLHYSVNDHTYQEHVVDLMRDLEACGACIERDVETYSDHGDVSMFFPALLRRKLLEE